MIYFIVYCILYVYIYIYNIYIYIYIYHHVVPLARISLTLSRHSLLYHSSLLAGLQGYIPYPHIAAVCMFEAGRPAFAWPYVGVHRSTSTDEFVLCVCVCT